MVKAPHKAPAKRPIGRPVVWTEQRREQAQIIILQGLTEGMSLTEILKEKGMPSYWTVCEWLKAYPEFTKEYARAREASADLLEAQLLDIARAAKAGEIDGSAARAAADQLKWVAGKRKPKVYGDVLDINHTVTDKRVGWVIDLTPEPVSEGVTAQIPAQSGGEASIINDLCGTQTVYATVYDLASPDATDGGDL